MLIAAAYCAPVELDRVLLFLFNRTPGGDCAGRAFDRPVRQVPGAVGQRTKWSLGVMRLDEGQRFGF